MRIGLFTDTYYPEKNGVAVSTYQLKQSLEKLGHQVYVFTIENEGAEEEPGVIRLKAVNAVVVDGQKVAVPLFHHYLRLIQVLRLDVIHTQTEFTIGILGWRAAKRFGIPHVHTYHTVYEEYTDYIHLPGSTAQMKHLIRKLSAWWCNQTDLVIAPTKKTRDLLQCYQVLPQIRIIPTGLQLEKFAEPDQTHVAELRVRYGLRPGDRVLVYLGRVSWEKNIDQLIRYMEPVSKGCNAGRQNCGTEENSIKLLIVGGGPEEAALHTLAGDLEADGRVIFTGMVPWDQVQDYYALGDIFVSASTSETQGLTYYEAMASGLPLLARRDDCLETILTDGVQGYQFTDEDSFRSGLEAILADLDGFSRRAKETADGFTAGQFAARMETCYQEVIENVQAKAAAENGDPRESAETEGPVQEERQYGLTGRRLRVSAVLRHRKDGGSNTRAAG